VLILEDGVCAVAALATTSDNSTTGTKAGVIATSRKSRHYIGLAI
jgi:hypothetical protein